MDKRLQRAFERGLKNGQLNKEIKELGELQIRRAGEAEALCWALRQLDLHSKNLASDTHELAFLFRNVESRECAAFEVLVKHGLPRLYELYEAISRTPKHKARDLLALLVTFALYATEESIQKIISAARQPLAPDDYMWELVLRNFVPGNPGNEVLFNTLRDPLPTKFLAIALLDAANENRAEGEPINHPFDSAEGARALKSWLVSKDKDKVSYAVSAAKALRFITHPERRSLITLASQHPDPGVQVLASVAKAGTGDAEGLKELSTHCLKPRTAQPAMQCLFELDREDLIPPQACDPEFQAKIEFGNWLAHPSELGKWPDTLEIIDQRELPWPPEREKKPFWLVKYSMKDETDPKQNEIGCGLVGSVTFCFFSYDLHNRPPEDAYAIHCYWEMTTNKLIEECNLENESDSYDSLAKQWHGAPLADVKMCRLADIAPELHYPQRLVGLAQAKLNGKKGWVVLDGPRSKWVPNSRKLPKYPESEILSLHIGKKLLGFAEPPSR